jgi:hypothetical protein
MQYSFDQAFVSTIAKKGREKAYHRNTLVALTDLFVFIIFPSSYGKSDRNESDSALVRMLPDWDIHRE